MIDINKLEKEFKNFINSYNSEEAGFKLKVVHTYKVAANSKMIAEGLKLDKEDIDLAYLIGILHDIGRFEEINYFKQFDSVSFDHALYGVKILFEDNLIRQFIENNKYDNIIKVAIENHSRFKIEDGLDAKELLHAKIIRDADKLDNFRIKKEESLENIFPGIIKDENDIKNSTISDAVYKDIMNNKCVNIKDRKTPLDYWLCVLAFMFDLNFKSSYEFIIKNNYIDIIIDRFKYNNQNTKERLENIRKSVKEFINKSYKK